MSFVILIVIPVLVPAIGALVLAAVAMSTRSTSRRRKSLVALWCATALTLLGAGFWFWFFRDGLGPGMRVSTGTEAWRRFLASYWWVAAASVALMIGAGRVSRVPRP